MDHWKYPHWVGFLIYTACEEEAYDSKRNIVNCFSLTHMLHVTLLLSVFLSTRSPGRSPSCYDNEIVMMNHVYKERFPKVSLMQTNIHSICMHTSTLSVCLQTISSGTALIFTLKILGLDSAVFFWWLVACAELQITWIRVNTSSLFMQLFPPFLQRVKKYWVLYFSQVKWR